MEFDGHIETSQIIALLCAQINQEDGKAGLVRPFSPTEWSTLEERITQSSWGSPNALAGKSADEIREMLDICHEEAARIAALLGRGVQLGIELERLDNRGIWMLTRADSAYPVKLESRLAHRSPPVLFGAGPYELLSEPGVAVVGSRDPDPRGEERAKEIGERCAQEGLAVISGAARGVDRLAMTASLEEAGSAVGVIAASLEQTLLDPEVRSFLLDERLALITPFSPSLPFTPGKAMGRNPLIYCLADYAIVISSARDRGGTWNGATTALKSKWCPVFVRADENVPEGNKALIERGGIPLDLTAMPEDTGFEGWLESLAKEHTPRPVRPEAIQQELF